MSITPPLNASASETRPTPNVIVFGESGCGKSSVINMLQGGQDAKISDGAVGMTFDNTAYSKTINGVTFNIFDTVGLNEATPWSEVPRDISDGMRRLIAQLEDGVNLLVQVIRASRITETTHKNYEMFYTAFCWRKVPIVIVVVGLEDRVNMDGWWDENKKTFSRYGMYFHGRACITATKGKLQGGKHVYEDEYEESKSRVRKLIHESHSNAPWRTQSQSWFDNSLHAIHTKLRRIPPTGRSRANVVVFGETGVGKSSVVNMLEGGEIASVSDQAAGVTFSNTLYEKTIFGSPFKVYDTVGLNEGTRGTISSREAVEALYRLIRQMDDGVNLLVYVIRASRITATAQKNYRMFFELFCQKKVPIVIIVTGLESREDMDAWWMENRHQFDKDRMLFDGFACITAIKGQVRDGKHMYEAQYEESKRRLSALLYDACTQTPWKMPPTTWFNAVVTKARNLFAALLGLDPVVLVRELQLALQEFAGLSLCDAIAQANDVEEKCMKQRWTGPM